MKEDTTSYHLFVSIKDRVNAAAVNWYQKLQPDESCWLLLCTFFLFRSWEGQESLTWQRPDIRKLATQILLPVTQRWTSQAQFPHETIVFAIKCLDLIFLLAMQSWNRRGRILTLQSHTRHVRDLNDRKLFSVMSVLSDQYITVLIGTSVVSTWLNMLKQTHTNCHMKEMNGVNCFTALHCWLKKCGRSPFLSFGVTCVLRGGASVDQTCSSASHKCVSGLHRV